VTTTIPNDFKYLLLFKKVENLIQDAKSVFAWVAVFVLPLNAAVNPVLYTLSAVPIIRRSVVSNRRAVSLRRSVTNDPHRTMSTTMVPPSVQYNGDKVTFSLITKIPHRGPEIIETEMTTNGRSIMFGKMI
ncbi:G-protein coupled receptor GRL101-like, partial [Aphis craccivora]